MILVFLLMFLNPLPHAFALNQEGLHLLQVKQSLSDPTDALSSWNNRDDTPCNWSGISCNSLTRQVESNLLVGSLPHSLATMPSLQNLILFGNNFSGEIPSSFGQFQRLEYLNLAENLLDGTIPVVLGNISTLKELDLAYNPFFPTHIRSELDNLTNLEQLFLAGCNIIRQIPSSFGRLVHLRNLDLSLNRLTGSIPSSISELKNIDQIELYNNSLSLPLNMGNLTKLKRFDASMNELTGAIPAGLCGLQLESLNLYYNSLGGTLPKSITRSEKLHELKLFNNKLNGPLPSQLGANSPLQSLDLSYNRFSGEIPENLCAKRQLEDIILIYNSFQAKFRKSRQQHEFRPGPVEAQSFLGGEIPKTISSAHNLSILSISNNRLTGSLPDEIGSLEALVKMSVSGNGFTGQLPKLSGSIPSDIGSLPVLNYLDLSSNSFSGEVPNELQNLKLNVLNLSNNQLSGELPPLYANEIYRNSFVGNPGLCGDLDGLCPKISQSKNENSMWILTSIFILAGLVFVLEGSFGKVYKVLLSNGDAVAVKKISGGVKMGDSLSTADTERDEFETEVETLGKIRHKNIVRLWCCCNAGDGQLLVYEYMPNGSLGDLLHSSKGGLLDWPTRYKIALDAADGLSYLHHDCVPPIVHRDVKSNNILLDEEFSARVADFRVAKIVKRVGKAAESMSVITGSYGYIAPEYAYTLRVNEKSDIYSFGVVIFELVTGKPPTDPEFGEKDMAKWVCSTYNQKGMEQVVKLLQEASGENKFKASKDGKLSPYYCYDEEASESDQASIRAWCSDKRGVLFGNHGFDNSEDYSSAGWEKVSGSRYRSGF
ncbi:HAESA-like 1 isoform 2 [Hibiscus syriacus]|uniref:HAESA-like 1 isoform 2 n=1 Tax=Hibiscus syriacus TaxID=106335 RepID=A0A6A3BIQ5_HIBSY|nr:HAESA-like 1 isoform 2 [Hibiscus syriacus]